MLKKSTAKICCEPCNCGPQIRHNNGGNYHKVERVHGIYDDHGFYVKILEKTTSREDFPGDKYDVLVFQDGEFRLEDEDLVKEQEIVRVNRYQAVRFRKGEAEITWQNPQTFVEARRPRAEQLAATARAFGHKVSWEECLLYA